MFHFVVLLSFPNSLCYSSFKHYLWLLGMIKFTSGLPRWLSVKRLHLPLQGMQKRRWVLIPGSRRFSGIGNGKPLHYSCLGHPIDRGAWWATVHGVAESDTTGNFLKLWVLIDERQTELGELSLGKRGIDGPETF